MLLGGLTLAGCGTVDTVFRDDSLARQQLKDQKSYCNTVPRVYSGVAYDFCRLHSPRPAKDENSQENALAQGMVIDMVLSGALDTLLLPYTLIQQQADGSLVLAD